MIAYGSMIAPDQGVTPLMTVCRSGKLHQVKRVVETGANVNAISKGYRRTALTYAINDNIQPALIVDYRLKHGAKIEIKDID